MNAIEKLKDIEAEESLNAKGYFRVTCPGCQGLGYVGAQLGLMPQCPHCKGDGISWEKKPCEQQS